MNVPALLRSLRADLLDRRLLPLLVGLGLALAGAVAYATLAGGGSKPVAVAAVPSPPRPGPSLPVTEAPADPHAAVAETTEGAHYQHKAGTRNPFTPLVSPRLKTTATASAAASAKATSGTASSGTAHESKPSTTSPSSGGGAPSAPNAVKTTPAPPAPRKPKLVHKVQQTVSVLFGPAPTAPGQPSQLTPYASVKQGGPLPTASDPLVVFHDLSPADPKTGHRGAIFTLAREAILNGGATCLPSVTQCESIELQVGGTEELSYLEPSGQTVAYELVLQEVFQHETTATIARRHRHR